MASRVREIMNAEIFSVRPGDVARDALNGILALGITGAPVVGDQGEPLGLVALRDLIGGAARVGDVMTTPATTIRADASIADAGARLAETGRHRLVVVDAGGRAIGIVSAVDVIRGLLGVPAAHPAAFPHLDAATGLTWTDDVPLDLDHLDLAPDGPGLLQLVHGGPGLPERVVWTESCQNVYTRLTDMLAEPQADEAILAWWLAHPPLRFRAAAAADPEERREALAILKARARRAAAPAQLARTD